MYFDFANEMISGILAAAVTHSLGFSLFHCLFLCPLSLVGESLPV